MKEPETEKEINEAISDYTNLLNSSGWKRVVAQCDANIEELQRQLEIGMDNERYEDIKRIRDKLALLREMRNTPQIMIQRLESPETEPARPDPYDTTQDVQDRKKAELDTEEEE
jgi:excinuclease UvrABC nuclease subunit